MSQHREHEVTLRPATNADARELRLLAERDSSSVPDGALLIAAVEGEIRAAISLLDGGVIADPFHATSSLVELLVLRAKQLRPPRHGRRLGLPRPAVRPLSPQVRPSTS